MNVRVHSNAELAGVNRQMSRDEFIESVIPERKWPEYCGISITARSPALYSPYSQSLKRWPRRRR